MPDYENGPTTLLHYADAVLEGGGVRGIAHVGALSVAEARGYRWQRCAGTSAGALVAALLAAGYTAAELYTILSTTDFARFVRDRGIAGCWPVQLARLVCYGGLHTGNALEAFIRELLKAKGKKTFGDLLVPGQEDAPKSSRFRYRLVVIASDITNGQMLRLPQDLVAYGQDPDALDIALAVRMSASIPFVFQPILQRDNAGRLYRVVDGGLLSNFPVGIFDVEDEPAYPTLGFRLIDDLPRSAQATENLFRFGEDLLGAMLTAHDRLYLDDHAGVRTIAIPACGIGGLQFHLKPEQIEQLYQSGQTAAEQFFTNWNFATYKAIYRAGQPTLRQRQDTRTGNV
ncbi:MAG TPA: patatin-like phospholipase family protein [Ktedonobacteraceae bacterium]|nr:patatin-like phospholipase family protein [Ktedonobacteraceae bacterium]